jgi:transcriptional regulator with PAS, ATPase and Fis domain
VNCAALPRTLLESELFGYEKGAFTGAERLKPGKFELASDGVIFLDEIGDMPLALQAKLLQVLQSSEFNRIGGTEDLKVNAWVISSTNHDIELDMKQGLFREDLYYRLNIIKIELPPLRERGEDIKILTNHFFEKYQQDMKRDKPFTLNSDMRELFQAYHWPGNVRELSSTILRLLVGDDPGMVKFEIMKNMEADGLSPSGGPIPRPSEEGEEQDSKGKRYALESLKDLKTEATKYIEKKAILHALSLTGWNKRETAKILRVSYKALFYKMADLGIDK